MTGFLNRTFLTFFLVAVILSPILTVHSGICKEIRNNKTFDERVEKFLETRKGTWHDWNIPYSDGKVLYDLVLKNNYKKAKEWSKNYFTALASKIVVGGCFTAHNARNTGIKGIKEFLDYVKGLPNFKTTIDTTSSSGISISYKIAKD
jgi:hypothetical protein